MQYSRISGLLNAGLIKRHKGRDSLTLLGKVVYDSQTMIGKALAYYWKLKAIESIEMSSGASLPEGELLQLINALIDNHQIKDMLMKTISVSASENRSTVSKTMSSTEQRITIWKIVAHNSYLRTQPGRLDNWVN